MSSPLDARRQQVRLTEKGERAYETIDRRSAEEIAALLDEAPGIVEAMQRLRNVLEPREVVVRGLEPGDLGWLVERHGVLYAREYGWDQSFERLVAQIAADFDPTSDRAWVAETHERLGAVLCVHHDDTTAKLRTLLVEPQARGLGLGTTLVQEVIRHAKQRGYETLTLWTNDILTAARRIYEREGFTLQHEAPNPAFGHDLVEQTWSLTLSDMDRDQLRALQAPLKAAYKEDPGQALITLKAKGTLNEGISCSVDTGRAIAQAGLHPATGGDGTLLCSGDMLLEALVACAGVTLGAVATALDIAIENGNVHAEGDLDFRGTLGVDKEAPVGFEEIRLSFELETDADDEQLATLLKLTERYCVVYQTLARGPRLHVAMERAAAAA